VRYVRHQQNQGYDRNLDSLFANALGQYVLLVGDDDYPLPGALDCLWAILHPDNGESPGLVYCYHELIDGVTGEQRELKEDFFRPPNGIAGGPKFFKSGVDLLRQIDAPLNGGLTGTVFQRAAWLAADRERFIGTNFLQLAVAYQVAARHAVCVDYRPLFVVRVYGNHRWPANGELYFGLLKAGRPLLENYPADIAARFRRRNDWAVRRAIASYRSAAPTDRQLVRIIRDSLDKDRLGYWLIDLPLLAGPGQMFSLVRLAGRVFGLEKS
jgi:glycosyltransferase involved in cell wall biosynthesis